MFLTAITLFLGCMSRDTVAPIFKQQLIDSSISIGYGLAIGDVDGDKKKDILLADKKQVVWYRNGDWKKFIISENLTEADNVCIAARDVDGDGKVEIAVGGQWNPNETTDSTLSGSIHFMQRIQGNDQQWVPIRLNHVPTIHRMNWVKNEAGKFFLVVLPLHGINNKFGEGKPADILVFPFPELKTLAQPSNVISTGMHMTHNFDVSGETSGVRGLLIAGKEGVRFLPNNFDKLTQLTRWSDAPSGEVRLGKTFFATIEPMHGNRLTANSLNAEKNIIDSNLAEGHALGVSDFFHDGNEQIVAGWRKPNKEGKVGIKFYEKDSSGNWTSFWIDENGMACEDLQIADLDDDGFPEIIAAGRASRNVKIYWNRSLIVKRRSSAH